jgi:hypothetical protein
MAASLAAATAIELATVATTAISIAATIQSTVQANKTAKAQEAAQAKRNQQQVEQTVANYDELAEVERESQQKSLEDSFAVQKDYIQSKGRVNVMAAAMGTGGQSVSGQLQDVERTKYSNYNTILLNRQAELDNVADQAKSLRFQAASNMDVTPISRPSFAAAALNIGSQVVSGYSSYKSAGKQAELLKSGG